MPKLCNLQCNAVLRRGRKGIRELRQRTNRKAMQRKWRLLPARKLWYGGYGREGRSCNPAPRLKKIGASSPVYFDRITLTKRAELEAQLLYHVLEQNKFIREKFVFGRSYEKSLSNVYYLRCLQNKLKLGLLSHSSVENRTLDKGKRVHTGNKLLKSLLKKKQRRYC